MRRGPGDGDAMGVGDLLEVQSLGAGGVRIAIATHRVIFRGMLKGRQQLRAALPLPIPAHLRRFRVPADLEGFVHGLQYQFEFAARMGGVDRAKTVQPYPDSQIGGGQSGAWLTVKRHQMRCD